jgi:hypothetical protein
MPGARHQHHAPGIDQIAATDSIPSSTSPDPAVVKAAAVELAPAGHAELPFGRGIRDQASEWTAAQIGGLGAPW